MRGRNATRHPYYYYYYYCRNADPIKAGPADVNPRPSALPW